MEQQQLKFPGFPEKPQENYWQYPKVMNGYWHQLSGTEQKVLDYILRHTWGYQKTADRISLSQFKNGIIIKKTGERMDWGIGIKKDGTIIKAIEKLEKLGFIETFKKVGKTTEYHFRLLTKRENTTNQKGEVATNQKGDTINNVTINKRQYSSSKKLKPFFRGEEMRFSRNKWWVLPEDGSEWLEFAAPENEIEWK